MKTYVVTSWVDRPSIIEAYNREHAKNIYANQIGYTSWDMVVQALGERFAVITVEELVENVNKHSESRAAEIRAF